MDKRWLHYAAVLTAGLFFLPGCFLAPHYERPTVETPPAFKESAPNAGNTLWKPANPNDSLPRGPWWEMFGDPVLNQLEAKVAVSNQTVKQAEAEYREARAIVSETQAAYFPTIGTAPSVTRSLAPNVSTRNNVANAAVGAVNIFDLPVTASWEPDFWGAVAFAVRTAKAEAQASQAQLESMRLSIQAELASDYFSMEAIDMETSLLNSAIDSYQKALQLTVARYNGGVASKVDVAEAQTQLSQTLAQSTDLGIMRAQMEHAIAVLVGQSPATFSLPPGQIRGAAPSIPTGLPSQLLERRPDIAAAERLIVAANGQIGLARAAYFPAIALTATGGYESNTLSNWLSWPQRFWSIGASAAETLIDFGRRRAVSKQAQAAYDAQVAAYRQTVLSAFQEVEDNLAALRLLTQEDDQQNTATKAAEDSLQLELTRYKAGTVSFLDVITTENIALTNERSSAQVLGRQMTAAVTLIRAIGGGWSTSQLDWPHNMESPPKPSNVPASAVTAPNPPAPPPVIVSTVPFASASVAISSPAAVAVPVAVSSGSTVNVSSAPAVSHP